MNIDWINNWTRENKYGLLVRGNNPNVVIVGETHGKLEFVNQQEKLIERLKPEYFLHEFAGISTYNPFTHLEAISPNRITNEWDSEVTKIPHYLLELSEKHGVFLVGCDLSIAEIDEVGKILARKYPEIYNYDQSIDCVERFDGPLTNQDDEVIPYRDRKMAETIVEYIKKTRRPLVAVVGVHHMRPESPIHEILSQNSVGYVFVDQSFERKRKIGLEAIAEMDFIY